MLQRPSLVLLVALAAHGDAEPPSVLVCGGLEPVEGGLRVVLARVAHRESGFALRSSEPILVTAPR